LGRVAGGPDMEAKGGEEVWQSFELSRSGERKKVRVNMKEGGCFGSRMKEGGIWDEKRQATGAEGG